jgi:hypothetical protein
LLLHFASILFVVRRLPIGRRRNNTPEFTGMWTHTGCVRESTRHVLHSIYVLAMRILALICFSDSLALVAWLPRQST